MIRLGGLSKCQLQAAWLVSRQMGRSLLRLISKRGPKEQRSRGKWASELGAKAAARSIPGPPWPGIPGTGLWRLRTQEETELQ